MCRPSLSLLALPSARQGQAFAPCPEYRRHRPGDPFRLIEEAPLDELENADPDVDPVARSQFETASNPLTVDLHAVAAALISELNPLLVNAQRCVAA